MWCNSIFERLGQLGIGKEISNSFPYPESLPSHTYYHHYSKQITGVDGEERREEERGEERKKGESERERE